MQSAGIAVYSLADRFAPRLLGHITQPGVDVRVYAPTVPIEVADDLFLVAPVTTSQPEGTLTFTCAHRCVVRPD